MLDALSPEFLAEAKAARETVPLEDGWWMADTIAGAFHDEMEVNRAIQAGRSRVNEDRLHKRGSYIPKVRQVKRGVEVNQTSIDITQRIIESQFLG